MLEWQSSGTPFLSMDQFPFTEDPRSGLGGQVRWTFARTTLWHQKLGFIAAPFVDIGRPFDGPLHQLQSHFLMLR